jgi:hypothetical protein
MPDVGLDIDAAGSGIGALYPGDKRL